MSLRSRSTVATNGEEPSLKKKNKKASSLILPHTTISSLPNDLLLNCFARISKLYYPTLSLVSKSFRALLASPELYQTRSLLGRTESCLYVLLRFPSEPNFRWFTLCQRPDTKKKKTKKQSSGNLLVPIRFQNPPQAIWSSLVAIGYSIYSMGGFINSEPSSNVSILDCRSHTCHQAPNMQVSRRDLAAHVIDGKIYVIGGRTYHNSASWIEVFDPKTQIWNSVSSPGKEICGREIIDSTEIDGQVCIYANEKGVAYNPKDGTCEPLEWDMCKGWVYYSHCVIENVVYYYHNKVFKWFDSKTRLWKNLKGLEGIMTKIVKDSNIKLADYGGKIAVLWDKHLPSSGYTNKVIWCAVIAVEKSQDGDEIWGMVEWVDVVLTVPMACKFVRVLSTTL